MVVVVALASRGVQVCRPTANRTKQTIQLASVIDATSMNAETYPEVAGETEAVVEAGAAVAVVEAVEGAAAVVEAVAVVEPVDDASYRCGPFRTTTDC